MEKSIKLFYHDGFSSRNPIKILSNILKFGTLHHRVYNLGDQISPIVVSKLAGRPAKHVAPSAKNKLVAVGSILASVRPGDIIWGSGLKVEDHIQYVKKYTGTFTVNAVRGPKTREVLIKNGIDCPAVYGDPALLLPLIYSSRSTKKYRVGVIPHIKQVEDFRAKLPSEDTLLISPAQEWQEFINNICSCEYIISSSLHGVIISEAYRVPAVTMIHGDFAHNSSFKYLDYYESTNREPEFIYSKDVINGINIDYVENLTEKIGKPNLDLMPLLKAFPYLGDEQRSIEKLVELNLLK